MISDEAYIDSEILASLRVFVGLYPSLAQVAGPIAQYKIVLDANIAVGDLLHKYKNPHIRQTALEETVKSSAIELHAPSWLDKEMTVSAIPQVARRKGIPEAALQTLWIEYRAQIIWDDKLSVPEDDGTSVGDAKDVPYVALQKSIAAAAVLSRDKDIEALGGKRVTLEFVFAVQSYARAASYAVGIRVGGVFVTWVSVSALGQIAKMIGSAIARLPPAVKIALVAGLIFVAVHPQSRERILESLKALGETLADAWPAILRVIEATTQKQMEAQAALENTERLLNA